MLRSKIQISRRQADVVTLRIVGLPEGPVTAVEGRPSGQRAGFAFQTAFAVVGECSAAGAGAAISAVSARSRAA